MWASGILYNQQDFNLKGRTKRKTVPIGFVLSAPVCMQLSHLQPSLTLSIRTFCLIKGKENKLIIILYISVVFLCYTPIYTFLDLTENFSAHPSYYISPLYTMQTLIFIKKIKAKCFGWFVRFFCLMVYQS